MNIARLLIAGLLLVAFGEAQLSCDQALELHEYALQELGACSDPASQNTQLCGLIGAYEDQSSSNSSDSADPSQTDQLTLITNPLPSVDPWQNFLVQSTLTQVADIGDVSYILSQVNAIYANFSPDNTSNDDYYAAWQLPWWQKADSIAALAGDRSTGFDALSTSNLYWKAANYYFTGLWPYPWSTDALSKAKNSVDAFRSGLNSHPDYNGTYFTTDFNNGTATAQLSGILITPRQAAGRSGPLPLVIITGGTDYPKELNVLQFGLAYLERGYALLVYDGPGQGQVIRQPPHMPFYGAWEKVLAKILDYVVTNFKSIVQVDNIIQEGVSLGGYLGSRACSGNSDRLVACLPNPPQTDVAAAYEKFSAGIADSIYAPFQYVGQQNPSLLPNGYAAEFQNYMAIIDSILLTCNASSNAPELLAEALSAGGGPIDPELVYLAGGYGGGVTGDQTGLYLAMWQGFRNVQAFGKYNVANITVPVIGFKSTQDDLLGGQEDTFFAQLNDSTKKKSILLTFDGASGGALHNQVGSPYIRDARQFGALNNLKLASKPSQMSSGAPTSSPAATSG